MNIYNMGILQIEIEEARTFLNNHRVKFLLENPKQLQKLICNNKTFWDKKVEEMSLQEVAHDLRDHFNPWFQMGLEQNIGIFLVTQTNTRESTKHIESHNDQIVFLDLLDDKNKLEINFIIENVKCVNNDKFVVEMGKLFSLNHYSGDVEYFTFEVDGQIPTNNHLWTKGEIKKLLIMMYNQAKMNNNKEMIGVFESSCPQIQILYRENFKDPNGYEVIKKSEINEIVENSNIFKR